MTKSMMMNLIMVKLIMKFHDEIEDEVDEVDDVDRDGEIEVMMKLIVEYDEVVSEDDNEVTDEVVSCWKELLMKLMTIMQSTIDTYEHLVDIVMACGLCDSDIVRSR